MGVKWNLYKISNCETRKSRKWCRWEDASNFSSCPGLLKRRNRVLSFYVAPACLPGPCPPKPSSSRRGRRLQRRRWRAVEEEVKMGTTRSARWGEGGSWAKMALPAPPCPAPTTAQRCLAWAPLESNLQSDPHTQRGRVWGRAPKKGKKRPFQEKSRSNCER